MAQNIYKEIYTTKCYRVDVPSGIFYIGSHFGTMYKYKTSSRSFKKYLKDNNISWVSCKITILMEELDEKIVRKYEQYLNCEVYNNDVLCFSRNTLAINTDKLFILYLDFCKYTGNTNIFVPLSEMVFYIEAFRCGSINDSLSILKNRYQRGEKYTNYEIKRLPKIKKMNKNKHQQNEKIFRSEYPEYFDWLPTADYT